MAPWGPGDVIKAMILVVVLLFVLGAAAFVVLAVVGSGRTPLLVPILLIVQDVCLLVGVWAFGLHKHRVGLGSLGLRPFAAGSGCAYAAFALPMALGFNAFYALVVKYGLGHEIEQPEILPLFGTGLSGFAMALLIVSLVAPFIEEMFFRGFVFAGLARRWGLWAAAIVSGVIFSAAHMSVDTFLPLGVFGVILALLYSATGSIYPGIVMHSLNNTLGLLVAYLEAAGLLTLP